MRVVVIANCASGQGHELEARTRTILDAFAATGVAPEVRCVEGPELARVAAQVAAEAPDAVVAAGGDGTVSAVASALAGTNVRFGVLPMGTLNHFAKDAGIPLDLAEAARVVVAARTRRVDAARVNDRVFVNNSSIGIYPHVVRARDKLRAAEGASKRAAMLRAGIDVLRRLPVARIRLVVDGAAITTRTPFLFIGNNRYALEGLRMGKRDALDGARLAVVHTRRSSPFALILLALRALFGQLDGARDLTVEDAREARVEASRGDVKVSLDGEVVSMRPPLVYRTMPGALSVIVP